MIEETTARSLADDLERRGLAAPARVLLAAHRPIAPLMGSAATFLSPLVGAAFGARGERLVRLLERTDGVDALIDELDATHETGSAEDGCRAQET